MNDPSTSSGLTNPKTFLDFLQNLDSENTNEEPAFLQSNLETDFLVYSRQQRLPLNTNILQFWHEKRNTLSTVAHVILAIPSTQVSVERSFSALKYILADQRNRLSAFNLEHILLAKLNGSFKYDN